MLLGRSREVAEIDRLLGDARTGQGRGMLLSGEPGIGKSALLELARERAAGMRVIGAVGIEAEATLPFAALAEIAGPLIAHLDALPERQAAAIRTALALDEEVSAGGDRLAACAGLLALLRVAAAPEPVLVLIDDAHWLDSASAECLGYAARRLDGCRVALLAAARPGHETPPLDGRIAHELRLEALEPDDARALLHAAAGDLAATTAHALLDAAAGNPLALLELPSLLTAEQRNGVVPPEFAPAPNGALWEAFESQVAGLGDEVAAAMLVVAASLDQALAPVVGACRDLDIAVAALERAEAGGLIRLGDDSVAFSHPLLRAVVHRGAPGAACRRAHAALVRHVEEDAAAWHRAAAALGPDAAVADALSATGHRAAARGAYGAAADALERAARLSEDRAARSQRLFEAGLTAAMGGAYQRGAALLEPVAEIEDPAMRAGVRHLLAMVTLTGGFREAHATYGMLIDEAERIEAHDPGVAATLYSDAGLSAVVGGDCRLALEAAGRAVAALPDEAPATARCQVLSMYGMALALRGRAREARRALDEAGRLLARVDALAPAAQSICFALHGRICTGQEAALRAEAEGLAAAARAYDTLGLISYYRLVSADSAYRRGDWEAAAEDSEEAVAIADDCGQRGPLSIALVIRARLHAARGEEEQARGACARAFALAEPPGFGSTVIWGRAALGFLEVSLARPEAAIEQLEEAARLAERAGLEDPTIVPWAPDLVEAYAQVGRLERGAEVCADLARRAERANEPLPLALADRCRGLVAVDGFDEPFTRSLRLHEECSSPLERARTLLAFGARLHRARRRVEARERLREALAEFERLGAAPWARRARAELRAAGAIRRPPSVDRDELTAQEARVALGVVGGATNREVAAELFLSPKTVEFHLGRVYRKLGVRSRTELAALVAEGGVDALSDRRAGAAEAAG